MNIIIECDCGTKTRVPQGEPLVCKNCGSKPTFRYTSKGFYRSEGAFHDAEERATEAEKADFMMFKRLFFQVRDKAIDEKSYLYFLAGYFSVIPTPADLKIPEKGYFKIEEKPEDP
jgi:hypothetical protein